MELNEKKFQGTCVTLREGESINQALKRFKRKVEDADIFDEYQKHKFYEKPSVIKKREKGAARARWLKKQSKNENL